MLLSISNKTWTSEKMSVPDGVTSLRAVALVISDNLGLGFTPVPQKVTKYTLCIHLAVVFIAFDVDVSQVFLLHRGCCASLFTLNWVIESVFCFTFYSVAEI